MVSTEKLVKIFFIVMPQRYKMVLDLRRKKAEIDKKFLADESLDAEEIKRLIEIIGKDHFFRKAESREEPTLRRIMWKLIKSIKNFDSLYEKAKEENVYPPIEMEADFDLKRAREKKSLERDTLLLEKNTANLRQLVKSLTPEWIKILQRLDLIFIYEYNALKNGSLVNYKNYLLEEQELCKNAKVFFNQISDKNRTFFNLVKMYFRIVRDQGLGFEILALTILLILWVLTMGVINIFAGSAESTESFNERMGNMFFYGGLSTAVLTISTHVYLKGQRLLNFFKKTMI